MFTQEYEWYIRHLTEHAGINFSEVLFVNGIAAWCRVHGIDERDKEKPLKIVMLQGGAKLLVERTLSEKVLEERINATRVSSLLKSVGQDRSDLLNSTQKKLAYLFVKELAGSNPVLAYDDMAADEWIYEQLARIGITDPAVMRAA